MIIGVCALLLASLVGLFSIRSHANFTRAEGLIVNADNLGVVGLGVWEKSGKNQYAVTFRELFLENGQQRIAKIRSTIKLSSDKESFTGPFTTEIFDQDENLLFSASGMVSAVRVHVEPLP